MQDIQKNIVALLHRTAEQLRDARLPEELATQLEACAEQVYQPCMVAVVGQVKAGKSSFINALLGLELAKVGTTETTATINQFRYGHIDSTNFIRCVWRGGQEDYVDLDFINSLQGNDIETLRRADGIDHLEYYLLNPYLEQVILVDTPGTGAVVEEHQKRTAEFINLEQQLRERHHSETHQIGSKADAVIYLISSTARETDRAFLEAFQQVTQGQSRAFNAIGVMAKIDLYPDVMTRRKELAEKIASQLQGSLNTVVPVSSGIQRTIDRLLAQDRKGLRQLVQAMRRIPAERLEKFLDNEDFYLELTPDMYPIALDERKELLADSPWTVFTTIARLAANTALEEETLIQHVQALAGFDQLKEVLEQHFLQRSQLLRCYRVMHDAHQVLKTIRYQLLPALRSRDRQERAQQARFLAFIRQAQGDPDTARELEELVQERLSGQGEQVASLLTQLERDFANTFAQLEQYNIDFEALHQILDHSDVFTLAELDELRALLGLYGLELNKRLPSNKDSLEQILARQIYWREIYEQDENAIRRDVAQQVVSRYGFILAEKAYSPDISSLNEGIFGHEYR